MGGPFDDPLNRGYKGLFPMARKARDLLELYRKVETPPDAVEHLEKTPRMLVLRQSQIVVAAVAGLLVIVLAYLIGLAAGGDGEAVPADAARGPWVLKVIDYADSESGRRKAQTVAGFLEKQGWGEVTIQRSGERVAVTLGAWVEHPTNYKPAKKLRNDVRALPDLQTGVKHFAEADFWRITR